MDYLHIDIEFASDGHYKKAFIFTQCFDDSLDVIFSNNEIEIEQTLVKFAKQLNVSLLELKSNPHFVKFTSNGFQFLPSSVYDYDADGIIYNLNRQYVDFDAVANKYKSIENSIFKQQLSLSSFGIMMNLYINKKINAQLHKENPFKRILKFFVENHNNDKVQPDYDSFNKHFNKITSGLYDNMNLNNVDDFYKCLSSILDSNNENIKTYFYEDGKTVNLTGILNLRSYFADCDVDCMTLGMFDLYFNNFYKALICDNGTNRRKMLDFCTSHLFKFILGNGVFVSKDSFGEYVFPSYSLLTYPARFIVLNYAKYLLKEGELRYHDLSQNDLNSRLDKMLTSCINDTKTALISYQNSNLSSHQHLV